MSYIAMGHNDWCKRSFYYCVLHCVIVSYKTKCKYIENNYVFTCMALKCVVYSHYRNNEKTTIMTNYTGYALIENGYVHTDGLSLSDANEMLERHSRIFNDLDWDVMYMGDVKYKSNWDI